MAGKPWTPAEDSLLKVLTARGLYANEIAERMEGRSKTAIHLRRQKLGLDVTDGGKRRNELWRKELAARLGEPIASYLKRRYVDEHATYRELTAEMGINTRSLMKLLRQCGIDPIDGKEAVRRQIDKDPEMIDRLQQAGSTEAVFRKSARTRQRNWRKRLSPGESLFLEALHEAGLFPAPQLAVERYNIDFAFEAEKLAVEYDPRWHRSKRKRPQDARKDRILAKHGWEVLRIDPRTSDEFNIQKISDALKSRASTHPR